jgi:hypothetical protein
LSLFIGKIILFMAIIGGFYGDMVVFIGIVGLNIALNGGVAKPAPVTHPQMVFRRFRTLSAPVAAN